MPVYPQWLYAVAWCYLIICFCCAVIMLVDVISHRQKMWIMNAVWPITGLYFGPMAVWLYYRTRPHSTKAAAQPTEAQKKAAPTWEQVSTAVFHCGAGCTLGDMAGEAGIFAIGGAAMTFIAGSEFATKLLVDFVLAYAFGIFFQYFTIVPMRGLSSGQGILAAMRVDTISITAFQIGMFVWMALTSFLFFPEPHRLHPNMAVFWFMMQIAMIVGWATAYPANVWLLKKGWKEKMS
jgi:hypothetical protein